MRNFLLTARHGVNAGLSCLAAISMLASGSLSVGAGERSAKRASEISVQPPVFNAEHQSTIRISEKDGYPVHRGIRLGRNKSTMIEISRDLRDVIVSNPEIVDAVVQSSNRVYLIGKKSGQANAFFFDSNGDQIVTLEIAVEHDTAVIDSLFKRLLPGSNIKTEILNETVILTGMVRNPADSSRAVDIASRFIVQPTGESEVRQKIKVINLLQVDAEEQVMLRVKVAEVERTVLKQFGVNLGASINSGNIGLGVLTENALPLTSAAGLGTLPLAGFGVNSDAKGCAAPGVLCNYNTGPKGSFGNSGIDGSWGSNSNRISQAVRMMERNGLVRTLAEPNLTAISGETAKFLAGGEYPVPVVDSQGKLSVSYKEFGVGVSFTPIVLSEGRINLKIKTEVSELSDNGAVTLSGISIPALKKRQAESTVELPSGGTLAMAGLLSEDTRKNIDGFPGLKDLPILGTLFRSQDFKKAETELVVLVTPYTARPNAQKDLALPTDGLAAATDMKSNLLGHMNRIYGKADKPIGNGSIKDDAVGFIVD